MYCVTLLSLFEPSQFIPEPTLTHWHVWCVIKFNKSEWGVVLYFILGFELMLRFVLLSKFNSDCFLIWFYFSCWDLIEKCYEYLSTFITGICPNPFSCKKLQSFKDIILITILNEDPSDLVGFIHNKSLLPSAFQNHPGLTRQRWTFQNTVQKKKRPARHGYQD